MTADYAALGRHPAPHRESVSSLGRAFGLVGGPLAWYLQLCAGYGLASWSCFPKDQRGIVPLAGSTWSWPLMVVLLIASVIVALAALFTSVRMFERTRNASGGGPAHLLEGGPGRTRFVALWGMLLGAGFAVATVIDAVAFVVLPRCAG